MTETTLNNKIESIKSILPKGAVIRSWEIADPKSPNAIVIAEIDLEKFGNTMTIKFNLNKDGKAYVRRRYYDIDVIFESFEELLVGLKSISAKPKELPVLRSLVSTFIKGNPSGNSGIEISPVIVKPDTDLHFVITKGDKNITVTGDKRLYDNYSIIKLFKVIKEELMSDGFKHGKKVRNISKFDELTPLVELGYTDKNKFTDITGQYTLEVVFKSNNIRVRIFDSKNNVLSSQYYLHKYIDLSNLHISNFRDKSDIESILKGIVSLCKEPLNNHIKLELGNYIKEYLYFN